LDATVGANWLSEEKMGFMKRRSLLMGLLLLMAVAGFRCKKSAVPAVWTGKLVVFASCADYVVQLQSGPISDSSVLTKSWTDSATGSVYTNVFKVSDVCTFAAALVNVGDVFTFTLNGPTPSQICNTCDIVPTFPMPATSNSVTNIKLVSTQ
jgi:hypothetical protein